MRGVGKAWNSGRGKFVNKAKQCGTGREPPPANDDGLQDAAAASALRVNPPEYAREVWACAVFSFEKAAHVLEGD